MLRAASRAPRAASFVEIYQNCNIFNDGAFDVLKDSDTRDAATIRLEHGAPLQSARQSVIRAADGSLELVDGLRDDAVRHDAHAEDPSYAFGLSRLTTPTPIGVFRSVERPTYDRLMAEQLETARAGASDDKDAMLGALLTGTDTWTVA